VTPAATQNPPPVATSNSGGGFWVAAGAVVAVLTKADGRVNLLGDVALASAAVGAVLSIPTSVGIPSRKSEFGRPRARGSDVFHPVIAVSAEHGTGLGALLTNIVSRLRAEHLDGAAGVADEAATPITRERHHIALAHALEEVGEFERAWREDEVPATIAAVHLRSAVHVLDELVGSVSVDDVLDVLFREFCVGK